MKTHPTIYSRDVEMLRDAPKSPKTHAYKYFIIHIVVIFLWKPTWAKYLFVL